MTVQTPRASAAHPVIHERKSALARWSLRASLAAFLYAVAYISAVVAFYQFGLELPPWALVALAIGPGIGLILAGGGTVLTLGEMLQIVRRMQEFNPRETAVGVALDDASEVVSSLRQGCLARAVVPLALILSMAALLLQVLSLSGGDALQVVLQTPPQSCTVSLAPFTLELNNSSSASAATWSASPVEALADGTPWAQVQPAQGTVRAGQRAQVAVIPNALVCQFLARAQPVAGGRTYAVLLLATDATYHVHVTSTGRTRRTTTLAMQIAGGTLPAAPSPTPTRTPRPTPRATATRTSTPRSPAPTPTPTPRPITPHAALQVTQNQTYSESCTSAPASAYTVTLDNRGSNVPIDWQFSAAGGWASASPSTARIGAGQTATVRVSPSVCPIGADSTTYQATLHLGFPQGGSQPDIALSDTIAGPAPYPALVVTQNQSAYASCYPPASYTITVNNLGGNVPVTWQFVPVEYSGGGVPWAKAAPPSGTLAAGQGDTNITVYPQSWIGWNGMYNATLQLSFPAGGFQAPISLTYTLTCIF
ncbi:MAG TPA: hypothetical protein VF916_15520 [Ktedonobacterales bacterium]